MNDVRAEERVFTPALVRRDGLLGLAAGALLPTVCLIAALFVNWLFGGNGLIAGLAGLTVGLGLLAVAYDYLAVGPANKGMRRRLIDKLRRLGELSFDPQNPEVYFVGLAYRERGHTAWETDDEIGFVEVTFDGLRFRGDRMTFEVDFRDLSSIEMVPVGPGLPSSIQRVRLTTISGEPFETLYLCSREAARLSASNAVSQTLGEAIRGRWQRRAPAARMSGISDETATIALRTDDV